MTNRTGCLPGKGRPKTSVKSAVVGVMMSRKAARAEFSGRSCRRGWEVGARGDIKGRICMEGGEEEVGAAAGAKV